MIKYKQMALNEGQPWNEWTPQDKERYRKRKRYLQEKQDKIAYLKKEINKGLPPIDRNSLQAEIDVIENNMNPADAFMHRINMAMQGYAEETNVQ
tara:strand:- start:904 stop:1188 length:285 start_codon:yes stop_codon:yes gene_type:complete